MLRRLDKREFVPNHLKTIAVDFVQYEYHNVEDDRRVAVKIWDTAGQERYRAITNAYYRDAVGALLVYDITCYKSFESIDEKWHRELMENADQNIVLLLVGNKSDLEDRREVEFEEAQQYANSRGMAFIETSALDSSNVE